MARNHPKFLHQNITGTKSDGEFVIHLLQPRLLFKVHRDGRGKIELEPMDILSTADEITAGELIQTRATQW